MSIGTIIGFITGIGLFIYAIIMGGASNPMVFIHPNSFLMVIGGTIAATFIAFKDIVSSKNKSLLCSFISLLFFTNFSKKSDSSFKFSFFIDKPAAIWCPPPFIIIFFSFAFNTKSPKSTPGIDLHEPLYICLFFVSTIVGLLNFSFN